jgi:hypothetical protein
VKEQLSSEISRLLHSSADHRGRSEHFCFLLEVKQSTVTTT